ncbi:hypothetical protein ScPMuIL_009002 [Solemya velum]
MNDVDKKFVCENCNLSSSYTFFGKRPPFARSIVLLEEAYVLRDPFSEDGGILVLGGHCSVCSTPICRAQDCSLFYSKRFCVRCVLQNMEEFPAEIQQEVTSRQLKNKCQ